MQHNEQKPLETIFQEADRPQIYEIKDDKGISSLAIGYMYAALQRTAKKIDLHCAIKESEKGDKIFIGVAKPEDYSRLMMEAGPAMQEALESADRLIQSFLDDEYYFPQSNPTKPEPPM